MPEDIGYADTPISYENEDEELLFGPTTRPEESMAAAAKRPVTRRPGNLSRFIPILTQAAESPDSPQELHDFLRVLQYHVGGRR